MKFIKFITIKVNFEAQASFACIFLVFFYTQKKKTERKAKHFSCIFKLMQQNKALIFLCVWITMNGRSTTRGLIYPDIANKN